MKSITHTVWFLLFTGWALSGCKPNIPTLSTQKPTATVVPIFGEEQAKNLIVVITGENTLGAGIIFERMGNCLFIATANHVVRPRNQQVQGLSVKFRFWNFEIQPTLYPGFSTDLDMAVLIVNLQESGIPDDLLNRSVTFDQIGNANNLSRRDEVYPIGHPGGHLWEAPVTPARVSETIREAIYLQYYCAQGYSGGGLFNNCDVKTHR